MGGTAEIVLAQYPDGRPAVLKRLLPDASPAMRSRLGREAEILGSIASPYLVGVYDQSSEVLVLEYVEGLDAGDLAARLTKRGEALPVGAAVAVGTHLARALTLIHGLGFVHADVSPGNVLIGRDGQTKLCDLGVARRIGESPPRSPEGTLAYQPPEQLALRPIDATADVYAAGLVLYELLTGALARPAGQLGMAELRAARQQRLAPPSVVRPGLPGAMDSLLDDVLAPSPGARPTAVEWLQRLERMTSDRALLGSLVEGMVGPPVPSARTSAAAVLEPTIVAGPTTDEDPLIDPSAGDESATQPSPVPPRPGPVRGQPVDVVAPVGGVLAPAVIDAEELITTSRGGGAKRRPDDDVTAPGQNWSLPQAAAVSAVTAPPSGVQSPASPPDWMRPSEDGGGPTSEIDADGTDTTAILTSSENFPLAADPFEPEPFEPQTPSIGADAPEADRTPLLSYAPAPTSARRAVYWPSVVVLAAAAAALAAFVQTRPLAPPTSSTPVDPEVIASPFRGGDPSPSAPEPALAKPVSKSRPLSKGVPPESAPPLERNVPPAPPPARSDAPSVLRFRVDADAGTRVSGPGMTGPAPQTSGRLSGVPSQVTLSAAGLSVHLRVARREDEIRVTVGAPPGTYYNVQCGQRPMRWTPLVDLLIEDRLACKISGSDGAGFRFELVRLAAQL